MAKRTITQGSKCKIKWLKWLIQNKQNVQTAPVSCLPVLECLAYLPFHLTAISFRWYVTWIRLNLNMFLYFLVPETQPLTSVNILTCIFAHRVSTTWFIQRCCDFRMQVLISPVCWCWSPTAQLKRDYKSELLKKDVFYLKWFFFNNIIKQHIR